MGASTFGWAAMAARQCVVRGVAGGSEAKNMAGCIRFSANIANFAPVFL